MTSIDIQYQEIIAVTDLSRLESSVVFSSCQKTQPVLNYGTSAISLLSKETISLFSKQIIKSNTLHQHHTLSSSLASPSLDFRSEWYPGVLSPSDSSIDKKIAGIC